MFVRGTAGAMEATLLPMTGLFRGMSLEKTLYPSRKRLPFRSKALLGDTLPFLASHVVNIIDHFFLAFENVALPCSTMICGDTFHRRFESF